MPTVKIHAPTPLPDRGLTEQKYDIWQNQLKSWLDSGDILAQFMPRGRYGVWEAEERNQLRLDAVADGDPDLPQDATDAQTQDLLEKRRRQLGVFLSQVASTVATNMYTTVIRHATSLQWVLNKVRQEHDLSQRGIHFMNLRKLMKYDAETMTPSSFYNQYRSHIINHTARNGD